MKREYFFGILTLLISMTLGGCVQEIHMAPRKTTPVPSYQPPAPKGSTIKAATGPLMLSQIECEPAAHWEPREGQKWVCATPNTQYIWSGSNMYYGGYPYLYGYPYMYGMYGAARYW